MVPKLLGVSTIFRFCIQASPADVVPVLEDKNICQPHHTQ